MRLPLGSIDFSGIGQALVGVAAVIAAIRAHQAANRTKGTNGTTLVEAVNDTKAKVAVVEAKVDVAASTAGAIADRLNQHYARVEETYTAQAQATHELVDFLRGREPK